MKPRAILYAVVLLLLLVFVFVNWGITTRVTVLVHSSEISLGALVAIIAGAVLLLDFAVNGMSRYGWQRERRTLEQEIERQRLRAEQAEGSRIAELRAYLERELAGLRAQIERAVATPRAPSLPGAPGAPGSPGGPPPASVTAPPAPPPVNETIRAQR